MLSVTYKPFMLSVVILSAVILSVIMLSVVMLSVVALARRTYITSNNWPKRPKC